MRVRSRDKFLGTRVPERVAMNLDRIVAKKQVEQAAGAARRTKKFTLSDAMNQAFLNYIAAEEAK